MRKLTMHELGRKSVEEFKQANKIPVVAVLDNVRSMHNVGSVFRTADGFLLHSVILCGYTPQPPHRDIQKTALGATDSVDWLYYPTTIEAVSDLRKDGFTIWAIEQVDKSLPLNEIKTGYPQKLAVIFGNEVTGVDEQVLEQSDAAIEIPQAGMKHSLNISVAAGIVLWELFKQYAPGLILNGSAVPSPQQNM
ncbi:MAG TPA: RNA methyltransferase [Flavitalea sp.]|nr:RNA methyltransferase [Flavitalea sp.]